MLRVVGRKAVLRAELTDVPKTVAPRRQLRPCVAYREKARRIAELEALDGSRSGRRVSPTNATFGNQLRTGLAAGVSS